MDQRPLRHAVRLTVVSLAGFSLLVTAAVPSAQAEPAPVIPSASQVAGAKAAVTDTAAQVSALDARLAMSRDAVAKVGAAAGAAAEAFNGAKLALEQRTAESTAAQAKAAAAQSRADEASFALSRYAADVYQQGGGAMGQLDVFFGGAGPQDIIDRAAGLEAVGGERARIVQEAEASRLLAQTLQREAAEAQTRQTAAAAAAQAAATQAQAAADRVVSEATRLQAEQQAMVGQLAALQNTSIQLEQQRQQGLVLQEQRRREEAARQAAAAAAAEAARQAAAQAVADAARAAEQERAARTAREQAAAAAARKAAEDAARRAGQGNGGSQPPPAPPSAPKPAPAPPPPPPTRGGVGAVIAFARAQIGKPYQWGAAGPDSWDCSGLTLGAWAQAGVRLSHFTGAQWNETRRVPISDLQPGDLVFYGSSGPTSYHMGLYIGNGQMINAPRTGDVVKVSSIYYMSDLLPYGGRP